MSRFHLVRILWDDKSLEELAKHELRFWEVEEAALYDSDRKARQVRNDEHGEKYQIIGTVEQNNKKLRVFVRPIDREMGIGRVITAWRIEK